MTKRLFITALLGLLLLLCAPLATPQPGTAQGDPVITTANASNVTLLKQQGRGRLLDMHWQGDDLLVLSTVGVWRIPLAGEVPAAPFIAFDAEPARTLAVSDTLLATADTAGNITVYTAAGSIRNQIAPVAEFLRLNTLFITADASRLVVTLYAGPFADAQALVLVYDLNTLALTAQVSFARMAVQEAAVHGDRLIVFMESTSRGNPAPDRLELLDLRTGDTLWAIEEQANPQSERLFALLTHVSFSPDGRQIAVAGSAGVHLLDAATGEARLLIDRAVNDLVVTVYDVVFTGADSVAFVETRFREMMGFALFTTADSSELVEEPGTPGFYDHIALNPAGNFAAYGGYAGEIMLRNLDAGVSLPLASGFVASADRLLVTDDSVFTGGFDGALRQWLPAGTIRTSSTLGAGTDHALAFNPDKTQLLYISALENPLFSGTFNTTDLSLRQRFALNLPAGMRTLPRLTTAQFTADGQVQVAAAGSVANLYIWPDASNAPSQAFELPLTSGVPPVYSPYTDTLFLLEPGDSGGTLRLIADTEVVRSLPFDVTREVRVVELLPGPDDATLLLVANPDCRLVLLDVAGNGATLSESTGPATCIAAVRNPADPNLVATLNREVPRTVRLRDVTTGEVYAELPAGLAFVTDAAFSPDGTRLYTSGQDGVVRVWGIAGLE